MPTPEELADAARARAAIAYADVDPSVVAETLGFSTRTLERLLAADNRELSLTEARKLASLCRVPTDFLLHGWTIAESPLGRRLSELDEKVQQLGVDAEARDLEVQRRLDEIASAIPPSRSQDQPPQ